MNSSEGAKRMRSADEAILEELRDRRLEYVALLANRRGLHLRYARERCRKLERGGFIERTTDEVTYRITEKGEAYLDGAAEEPTDGAALEERATASE